MSDLDARTFQDPLTRLTETLALKVSREAIKTLQPPFAAVDIYMMVKQSLTIFKLSFSLVAGERNRDDIGRNSGYSAAAFPLIRCMIDCLYNITVILTNPGVKANQFRRSGYKQRLTALQEDEARYSGNQQWREQLSEGRRSLEFDMRVHGFTTDQVMAEKRWPTLGMYLQRHNNVPYTAHQEFLKKLTYGYWREYSGMAHGTFEGLMPTACFFTPKDLPDAERQHFDSFIVPQVISQHLVRAPGILLCILTEIQAHFRFVDEGARINQRLHQIWGALLSAAEVKELYDERYAKLMTESGIDP